MKTLDDHNRDAYARMQGQEPRPKAHVACPKCHSEMEYEARRGMAERSSVWRGLAWQPRPG